MSKGVPNAPCGVESCQACHSVQVSKGVPNAPCGVERQYRKPNHTSTSPFLMHRVELKESVLPTSEDNTGLKFLMHRVELKGPLPVVVFLHAFPVPNAPCGVESWTGRN